MFRTFVMAWLVSAFALALPDVVLLGLGLPVAALWSPLALLSIALVAVLLVLTQQLWIRIAVLAATGLSQLFWGGTLAYTGGFLSPDHLIMASMQPGDVIEVVRFQALLFAPIVAAVLAGAGLQLTIARYLTSHRVPRTRAAGYVLLSCAALGAGLLVSTQQVVRYMPTTRTPSAFGGLVAVMTAANLETMRRAAGPNSEPSIRQLPIDAEPQTVVVIMGESISSSRLSALGFARDTTPNLRRWLTEPPAGFQFIIKSGFSGGIATFSSVPRFLRVDYAPTSTSNSANLFRLANASGFKSYFLSVQSDRVLQAIGASPAFAQRHVLETNEDEYRREFDGLLVKYGVDVARDRLSFVFFHQRTNHAPHRDCAHKEVFVFPTQGLSTDDAWRATYDNGLRCWDRNVADLVNIFVGRPGAVHIFITADHAELMGEDGLWGHALGGVKTSLVPMALLSNRPESPVAQAFGSLQPATHYKMAQLVARALGHDVVVPDAKDDVFFVNGILPYGRGGYFAVERLNERSVKARAIGRPTGAPGEEVITDWQNASTIAQP